MIVERNPVSDYSAVDRVKTASGETFDILGGNTNETAQVRASAYERMIAVASELEPGLLRDLRRGLSYEYMSSAAIQHSQNPEVKAELMKIWVEGWVEEGVYDHAVECLAYANRAELTLEGYGDQFALDLFNRACREGAFKQANRIAGTMARDYDKIVKPGEGSSKTKYSTQDDWRRRVR